MSDEFTEIGTLKALLKDARERIKESEERCIKKSDEIEKRLLDRVTELEEQIIKINMKMIEWLPLLSNLTKAEESKRNVSILLIVSLISNIAAWVLAIFIWFIKSGGTVK